MADFFPSYKFSEQVYSFGALSWIFSLAIRCPLVCPALATHTLAGLCALWLPSAASSSHTGNLLNKTGGKNIVSKKKGGTVSNRKNKGWTVRLFICFVWCLKRLNWWTFLKHYFSFLLGSCSSRHNSRHGTETIHSLTKFIQLANNLESFFFIF